MLAIASLPAVLTDQADILARLAAGGAHRACLGTGEDGAARRRPGVAGVDEGKHRGEKYGVRVTIENRKGSIDMEALLAHFGITAEQAEQFRGDSIAVIKVSPTA